MDSSIYFIVAIMLPLLGSALVPLLKINRLAYHIVVISLAVGNLLFLGFTHPTEHFVRWGWFSFLLDHYSLLFAMLVNAAWAITTVYSYGFTKYNFKAKNPEFYFWLHLVLAVVLCNGFAGNLVTLFTFYTLGIPLSIPLIAIRARAESIKASRTYILNTLLPALFLFLPAVLFIEFKLGHAEFDDMHLVASKLPLWQGGILLAILFIGISKNSIFPFNRWLPAVISSPAPAPIGALLYSVAAVKSGSIALVKIVVYVFGMEYVRQLTSQFFTGGWLVYLCGATAVYAAYRALKTTNMKERFALSTVSQLSYIATAILLGTPAAIMGATLHIVSHSFSKMGLFFVAGYYNSVYNTIEAGEIAKIAPATKPLVWAVALFGLSIIGFPYLAGFYSKDLILLEEIHTHNYGAAISLLVGSFINILYIYPLVVAAYKHTDAQPTRGWRFVPSSMLTAIGLCVFMVVSFSFYSAYVMHIVGFEPNTAEHITHEVMDTIKSTFHI